MSTATPSSDGDLLGLFRSRGPATVAELAEIIGVTPTAVRQRLSRLMAQGLIEREIARAGRGRPKHRYGLTAEGFRVTGSNFTDLALAMWREIRAIQDPNVRKSLMRRVAKALARRYAGQVEGRTTAERMQSLSGLLGQRRVPFSVDKSGKLPVLVAHACPYHELAEEDRAICVLERMLFSEVLGEGVKLARCRMDGGADCRFQTT